MADENDFDLENFLKDVQLSDDEEEEEYEKGNIKNEKMKTKDKTKLIELLRNLEVYKRHIKMENEKLGEMKEAKKMDIYSQRIDSMLNNDDDVTYRCTICESSFES